VLADFLNVPVGWVYKRTRQNGPELIPHIKLGKYIRFDPESREFQSWLTGKAIKESTFSAASSLTGDFAMRKVLPEWKRRA
ncbi:MAG TPA: hypothetical protein VNO70_17260, partial [Blastocatellia bacterium]|nr:hypothetical protein [Blastocatellia bacterium]